MITVPEATKTVIKRSRYLSEALAKNIINISALADYIKPEIEHMLMKKVSRASLTMSIKRIKTKAPFRPKYTQLINSPPEMILRSNLALISVLNSEKLYSSCFEFFSQYPIQGKQFFALSEGFSETTLIMSGALKSKMKKMLGRETVLVEKTNLASVTIQLPKNAIDTPGMTYFFLKSLAWEEINIVELISTSFELTLIFAEKDINAAFHILKSLFRPPRT
ncbi:MAG: hypothetical protein M1289_00860 [Patescibacteria group bacterium]|nr:hypothetical protein [Patescibacteria group bacterium]